VSVVAAESLKILVDVNLSPEWIRILCSRGWNAVHWTAIGPANATDATLFGWARENDAILLTQDLDFTKIIFHEQSRRPSVVLLRLKNELDPSQQTRVCDLIKSAGTQLASGAILIIDSQNARLRSLPIS
jgi:predicted nuclease of predicted toxin-antitoxin system